MVVRKWRKHPENFGSDTAFGDCTQVARPGLCCSYKPSHTSWLLKPDYTSAQAGMAWKAVGNLPLSLWAELLWWMPLYQWVGSEETGALSLDGITALSLDHGILRKFVWMLQDHENQPPLNYSTSDECSTLCAHFPKFLVYFEKQPAADLPTCPSF